MNMTLIKFAPNIYIKDYPIKYAGCHFNSRMTIVKLSTGQLWIHSPCEITPQLKSEIEDNQMMKNCLEKQESLNKISLMQDRQAVSDISKKLQAAIKNVTKTNRDLLRIPDPDAASFKELSL